MTKLRRAKEAAVEQAQEGDETTDLSCQSHDELPFAKCSNEARYAWEPHPWRAVMLFVQSPDFVASSLATSISVSAVSIASDQSSRKWELFEICMLPRAKSVL